MQIITADGRVLMDVKEIKAEGALHFEKFLNAQPNYLEVPTRPEHFTQK